MQITVESFREAFSSALIELGKSVDELVVLDADVASSTRTSQFAKLFPRRFIQIGISEQDLVGTAAGLALANKTPVVAVFSMFMLRAWEQIRNTVARDRLNVKFVGTHAGLSDHLDGSSHQCLEDISVMRVIPNMAVAAPADAPSTRKLLFDLVKWKGPAYMRIGRDYAPRVHEDEVELGKISILRDGHDVCLAACGVMVYEALEAAKVLEGKKISASVLDVHTIKPLDEPALTKLAKGAKGVVVAEEHSVIGGLGGAIAEVLSEKAPTRVFRVGVRDLFGTCSRDYPSLLEHYGLTHKNIAKAAEAVLRGG